MRVLKFGGSSVADADRIRQVGSIIRTARADGPIAVAVSALGGVTDELVTLADGAPAGTDSISEVVDGLRDRHLAVLDDIAPGYDVTRIALEATLDELERLVTGVAYIGDCPPAVRDRILATGERLSAPIVAAGLRASGAPSESIDGGEIIRTDSSFGNAEIDLEVTTDLTHAHLSTLIEHRIPVVTGFLGADRHGSTTTLGRGGSDLTATVLGAALEAERVEIWTDVNGIFTAPPRVVGGARPQPFVSYDEAAEMARFGAAVLFTKTIAPVRDRSIPVVVRNTFDPEGALTWVGKELEIPAGARSLASVERAAVIKIQAPGGNSQAAAAVALASPRCLIAAMAAADGGWTLVAAEDDADDLHRELEEGAVDVEIIGNTSVVSVIGSRLLQQPWVAGRSLEALGRRNVELQGMASPSEHAFCIVVDRSDHDRALAILHEALMLSHLAGRAADAARREALTKGKPHDPSSLHSRRDRCDRNRRSAARSPAA